MQLIEAIIKPEKLDAVKAALKGVGVTGMTVADVKGFGRQMGETESYRGASVDASFVAKAMLRIAVAEDKVESVVAALTDAARTGSVGDGKIFVYPLASVVRIRTGERDTDAI